MFLKGHLLETFLEKQYSFKTYHKGKVAKLPQCLTNHHAMMLKYKY